MTHAHAIEWHALAWFAGWSLAVGALFVLGMRLPLGGGRGGWRQRVTPLLLCVAALALAVLANLALSLHDTHFDLTREKIFTPAADALAVVDRLQQPVHVTYFFRSDDPNARRARDVLEIMQRRNPYLTVRSADPDKSPSLAANAGVKLYNAAVIEAAGRRVLVHGTDETEFAIGIERVLRERVVVTCFAEGHGEYASENFEFHTHLDSAVGHSHDDAGAAVVDTTRHGVGRLRRSLEGLGYVAQTISLAKPGGIPPECAVVIDAGPRTTYLPGETQALREYLQRGGAALLMYDLGFVLEPGLQALLAEFGVRMPPAVIADPQSHYGTDPEMVAVTGYESHPITKDVSYTFFPGVRPLLIQPTPGTAVMPLMTSSGNSTRRPVSERTERRVEAGEETATQASGPQILAAAIENPQSNARMLVIGDADFASNSFYPYAANSDLALAMMRWLLHEETRPAIASRIPVPPVLMLTKSQMQWVFLLVEILLPASVALLGAVVWWRRR